MAYSAGAQKRYNGNFEFYTVKLHKEADAELIEKIKRRVEASGESRQVVLKQMLEEAK